MARHIHTRRQKLGFTLIELLVVITLMTIAVGVAVFRLDGLTGGSRLRSGAVQITSILKLTQTQARTSGTPRLVEYTMGSGRIMVRAPKQRDGTWAWDPGVEYLTVGGLQVQRVLIEGDREDGGEAGSRAIRIGPDGRYRAHAVILSVQDRWAVAVLRGVDEPRCVLLDRAPHATSFELLTLELEQNRREG